MRIRLLLLLICLALIAPMPVSGQTDRCPEILAGRQQELLATFPRHLESIRSEISRENGPLAGYSLSHGDVVLAGMGLTLVQFDDPARPELLFYRPAEAPADEWLDFQGPDGPYELVGWGYLPAPYLAERSPPEVECIPSEEWFVHEAGWHLLDGDMQVTPESRLEEPEAPVGLGGRIMYWHPAGWDVHLWVRERVPEIGLLDPAARPGGMAIPEAFWYPEEAQDQHDVPDVASARPAVIAPQEGDVVGAESGMQLRFKLGSISTGSAGTMAATFVFPPGHETVTHLHEVDEEIVYVTEGELSATLGEETFTAGPGAVIYVPSGTWMSLANRSETAAFGLILLSRGEAEECFRVLFSADSDEAAREKAIALCQLRFQAHPPDGAGGSRR